MSSRAFKLVVPDPSEDELHENVARMLDLLLLPPAVWTTMPAGGYTLTQAAKARLFRLGYHPGWPDVQIIFNGLFHGIELKTQTGRLSKTRLVRTRSGALRQVQGQEETHELLRAAGAKVAVCRSISDVLKWIRTWGIPTREAA